MKLPDDPPPYGTSDAAWDCDDPKLPLDNAHIRELADNQLVHALLVGLFQDTPDIASQRVQRVSSIFERSLGTTRWYWRAGLSTAVAALILVGLVLFFLPTQNAQAQLDKVLDTFDAGDKTYQIEISEDADQPVGNPRRSWMRPVRRPTFKPARGRMLSKRLDGALLYVRNQQHVLAYTLPTGSKVARGFDGQQGWITGPPTGSDVFGSRTHPWRRLPADNDPNLWRAEISEEAVSLLLVDLRDMLHQIRKNYVVSKPCQSVSPDGTTPAVYLVADRITRRTRLPRRIELWMETETGQLHDILCTGMSFHRSVPPYALRITLLNTTPLSSDWFTPQAHVPGEPSK